MKVETDRNSCIRVNGSLVKVDVLNLSLFVDDEGGSPGPLVLSSCNFVWFQDSILGEDRAVHIAEQRKCDSDLLGEGGVRSGTIYTDSENSGIAGLKLGQISLNGLEFFRSTTGECENIERKHYVLLAPVVTQLDGFPFIAWQGEVGRHVADLEGGRRHGR